MIGYRKGMLTVIGERRIRHGMRVIVRCDCGTEREIIKSTFLRAFVSCGCQRRLHTKQHPLYRRWMNMKTRCGNPNAINYHLYGGRGIMVCERWQSFGAFREDMGPTWQPGLTIERIDNDGDYAPDNCRWATRHEQNRNQRNNVIIDTPWGRMHLRDAAAKSGIKYQTLYWRLHHDIPLFVSS